MDRLGISDVLKPGREAGWSLLEMMIAGGLFAFMLMGSIIVMQNFSYRTTLDAYADPTSEAYRAVAWMSRAVEISNHTEVDPGNPARGYSTRLDYRWLNGLWVLNNPPTASANDDTWVRVRFLMPDNKLHYLIKANAAGDTDKPGPPNTNDAEVSPETLSDATFSMVNSAQTTLRIDIQLGTAPERHLTVDVMSQGMTP